MSEFSSWDDLRIEEFIARANIVRFERFLTTESDLVSRVRISALLTEERQKLDDIKFRRSSVELPGLRIASDSAGAPEGFGLLRQMPDRLAEADTFEGAVAATLESAMGLLGAPRGNVQLPAGERLYIVEHRGFVKPFLDTFREVHVGEGSACGRAFAQRRPVIIPDVTEDEEYVPFRAAAADAGYRGVLTAPITTPGGVLIGFLSTHFSQAHGPTAGEVEKLDALCRDAGRQLHVLLGADRLDLKASRMQAAVYQAAA